MRSFSSLLLLLPLLLAGCAQLAAPACQLTVPAAHAGDEYTFDAEGDVVFPLTQGWIVADWRAVDPQSNATNSLLALPPGSQLRVSLGEAPRQRIDLVGASRSAYQATFWASNASNPRSLPFADEWIDAEHGGLIGSTQRSLLVENDRVWHQQRLSRVQRVPLLLAPLFWDHPLRPGVEGRIEFPDEVAVGPAPGAAQGGRGWLTYDVTETRNTPSGCHAHVTIELQADPFYYEGTYVETLRLELGPESALPIALDDAYPASWEKADLHLRLSSVRTGSGEALPAFRSPPAPVLHLPMAAPVEGFLPETETVFATHFQEALGSAKQDSTVEAWFRTHPGARLAEVSHQNGAPGATLVDRWTFAWVDADAASLSASVRRIRPSPLLPVEDLEVSTGPAGSLEFPTQPASLVSLKALAKVHEAIYGAPPETLYANLATGYWDLGTHNATGLPYAEAPNASGMLRPGLIVWPEQGWILIEDSFSAHALGPPAGVPT